MKKETSKYFEEQSIRARNDFIRDRGELANAPYPGKIPAWWLLEGTPEQVEEWLRQLSTGEAVLDK